MFEMYKTKQFIYYCNGFGVICHKFKTKLLQNNTISQSTPVYRAMTSLKVINYKKGNWDAIFVCHLSSVAKFIFSCGVGCRKEVLS